MWAVTPKGSSSVKSTTVRPERDGGPLHLVGRTGVVDQRRDHAVDVAA